MIATRAPYDFRYCFHRHFLMLFCRMTLAKTQQGAQTHQLIATTAINARMIHVTQLMDASMSVSLLVFSFTVVSTSILSYDMCQIFHPVATITTSAQSTRATSKLVASTAKGCATTETPAPLILVTLKHLVAVCSHL